MPETPSEGLRELARSYGVQVEYVDTGRRDRARPGRVAPRRPPGPRASTLGARPEAAQAAPRAPARASGGAGSSPSSSPGTAPRPRSRSGSQAHRGPADLRCRLVEGIGRGARLDRLGRPARARRLGRGRGRAVRRPRLARARRPAVRLSPADDRVRRRRAGRDAGHRRPDAGLYAAGAGGKRPWGVFCPLYALHREKSWGAGDLSDLEALIDWTAGLGGGLVATLPMLASNFDGPAPIISPYSPTSRLFWNEFYLDLARIPELADARPPGTSSNRTTLGREVAALRSSELVDYGRQMRLKRGVLEILADSFFAHGRRPDARPSAIRPRAPRRRVLRLLPGRRRAVRPRLAELARRARRAGRDAEVDHGPANYHLYAQWQADEQLEALSARRPGSKGLAWYLDFPVGVDFNSFDVWRDRDAFATGASVGCPPDSVFTKGQNWGFPPLHPDRQREQGYAT